MTVIFNFLLQFLQEKPHHDKKLYNPIILSNIRSYVTDIFVINKNVVRQRNHLKNYKNLFMFKPCSNQIKNHVHLFNKPLFKDNVFKEFKLTDMMFDKQIPEFRD